MYLATQKQGGSQGFSQGTFTVPDEERGFFTYLSIQGGGKIYTRKSSHFKGISPSWHWGWDTEQLPAGKRTVVFAPIKIGGEQRLYLKPEDYGCDPWNPGDFILHGIDFIRTRFSSSDRSESERKEHLPNDVKKSFTELQARIQYLQGSQEDLRGSIEKAGISAIIDYLEEELKCHEQILEQGDKAEGYENAQGICTEISSFWNALNRGYENPEFCKGNEVVITQKELGCTEIETNNQAFEAYVQTHCAAHTSKEGIAWARKGKAFYAGFLEASKIAGNNSMDGSFVKLGGRELPLSSPC